MEIMCNYINELTSIRRRNGKAPMRGLDSPFPPLPVSVGGIACQGNRTMAGRKATCILAAVAWKFFQRFESSQALPRHPQAGGTHWRTLS
jgi:hypothetical protein